MKKIILPLLAVSLLFSANTTHAEDKNSPYDFLKTELAKIDSSNMNYIQSEEIFAPLVNAFIANAQNDKEATKKYLRQLEEKLKPFFEQKITEEYGEESKKELKTAQNKIFEAIKNNNLYNIFKLLIDTRNKVEYCYNPKDCPPILLSRFSFSKIAEQISPKKAYEPCQDITTFYQICKNISNDDYIKAEDPKKLQLAVNYAKNPLKYYQEIRYKIPKEPVKTFSKETKELIIPEGEWSWNEAITFMEYNPQKAYNTLKKAQTLTQKLQLAIFLQAYFPEKIKEIKDILREVVKEFDNGDTYIIYSRKYNKEEFQQKFASELSENNTPISMDYFIEVITTASDKSLLDTQFLEIYCGIAKKMPEILIATKPYYGGNRDNFTPRLICYNDYDYKKFPTHIIDQYAQETEKADGGFLSDNEGTARFFHYGMQNYKINQAFLGILSQPYKEYKLKYPYEAWSYQSLENRKNFLEIKQAYLNTKKILMDYYINTRKLTNTKALQLTEDILFNYPYGTRNDKDEIPFNLRKLMIEEKTPAEINKFVAGSDFLEQQKNQNTLYDNAPLIHIAVQNPEYLKLLFQITKNMTEEEQKQYDLESNVNARNNINKTPLMVAAQFNLLESAKILLQAGADINAVTQTDKYTGLFRDNRTALMYAAENADLELIKLLLNNGADKNMVDTRGYQAIDYLMGFASGKYNETLSEEDFKEALSLLL